MSSLLGGGGLTGNAASVAIGVAIGAALAPLIQPLVTAEQQAVWSSMPDLSLSAADVADMVVQDVYTNIADAYSEAANTGVSSDRLDKLIAVRGLPPGTADMMNAWRRGIIDKATFEQIVRESHTKTKYTPVLERMFWNILSTADAVELTLKGALAEDQGIAIANANGTTTDDFRTMLAGTGNPIAPTEAMALANRGKLTKDEFAHIIRLGRTRDDQVDHLWELRHHIPSLFEVNRLVAAGSITDAEATAFVVDAGYDAKTAAGIVAAAHKGKTAAVHHLALSEVQTLYETGHLTEAEARSRLHGLGYDAADQDLVLAVTEAVRERKYLESVISRTHSAYVRRLIELPQAQTELEAIHVPNAAIKQLLAEWEHERVADVRRVTEPQVIQGVKKGFLSVQQAYKRLLDMGYPGEDANLIVANATGKLVPGAPVPA